LSLGKGYGIGLIGFQTNTNGLNAATRQDKTHQHVFASDVFIDHVSEPLVFGKEIDIQDVTMRDSSLGDKDRIVTKRFLMGSGEPVKLSLLQTSGMKAHGGLVGTIGKPCLVGRFNGGTRVKGVGIDMNDGIRLPIARLEAMRDLVLDVVKTNRRQVGGIRYGVFAVVVVVGRRNKILLHFHLVLVGKCRILKLFVLLVEHRVRWEQDQLGTSPLPQSSSFFQTTHCQLKQFQVILWR
jgi:hypothetical protein